MADILSFEARRGHARGPVPGADLRKPPPPRLHPDLRTRAGLFATFCSALLTVWAFGLALLAFGVLCYDGVFLSVAPDGLCIGSACQGPGIAHVGALAGDKRAVIAAGLMLTSAPALMVLAHLSGLFRLYAAGIVFGAENMTRITRLGVWLLAYFLAPVLVHRLLDNSFGLFPGRPWLRLDQAAALLIGLSLLLVARIIDCGDELEQRRDLFI